MTARKVTFAISVVLGLVLVGIIGWVTSTAVAAAAPAETGLKLEARSQAARFASDQPVRLDLRVTNATGSVCGLVDLAEPAVEVVDAARDGKALAPSFVHGLPVDGANQLVAGHLKAVSPGQSVDMPVDASFTRAVSVMTALRDGSALIALWPVDVQGRYEFHLRYRVPLGAGESRCTPASDVVGVTFQVGDASGPAWLPVGAAGGALLLLLLLVWLVWWRRHGHTAAKAAVLIVAAVGVVTVIGAKPARANIDIHDPGGNQAVTAYWSDCMTRITTFDPSVDTILNGTNSPQVDVIFAPFTERRSVQGKPHDSVIYWYPLTKPPAPDLQPGVGYDPCMELYHELVHAMDAATDNLNDDLCDDTWVLYDEVKATIAENKFRLAQKPPLPVRTRYEGHQIPPYDLNDCFRKLNVPKRRYAGDASDPRCRGINGPCSTGHSTGDPHLATLDGAFFDFQAVGEFVALKAVDGEVQVRQAPFPNSRIVSVNTAVAMNAGGRKVGFYLTDSGVSVHLDGRPATVLLGRTDLGGGVGLIREDSYAGTRYSVMWPDTMIISVSPIGSWGLQLDVSVPGGRKVSGLLGDFDGNAANDVPADPYGAFADGVRVNDSTSLFDYAPGESTAKFTDRSFPDRKVAAPSSEGAKQACQVLGIPTGPRFDACVLDVSVTGQPAFAASIADTAERPISSTRLKGGQAFLTVTTPGTSAKTTVHANAGERLLVLVTDTDLPDGCSPLHLVDPQNKELATGCLGHGTGVIEGTSMPSTGDYSVVLTPLGNATGYASLRLYVSTDEKQPLKPDTDVVATIDTPGAVSRLEFTAAAGQKVFVDMPSYSLPGGCGEVGLVDSADHVLAIACAGGGAGILEPVTIPTTGTYAIRFDPAGDATGQVRLRMSFITDITGTIMLNGPEIVTTVTQPGSEADYMFTAPAGQKVTLDISGSTFPDGCGVFKIVDPKGFAIAVGCTGNGAGGIAPITLPDTGTYTVRVDPPDRRVGSAHIRLHG